MLNIAQFLPDEAQTVRDQMNILLAGAAAIFLVSTTIFHLDRYRFTNFWAVTLVFTALCVILIGLAWALTGQLEDDEGVLITSQSQLDRYLQGVEPPAGSSGAVGTPVVQIPTGLLVQALDFPDPTSVTVNGLVWQRYPLESNVTHGFSLPQRIGEEATIEEVRREIVDDAEVILWAIGVTLRQTYDTSRFPFDQRTIVVRMAPADMTSPVLLTPDLDGYEILTPRALPGVDSQAGINNWTLLNSHFSYTEPPRRVDFGMREGRRRPAGTALQHSGAAHHAPGRSSPICCQVWWRRR
ncbi:MAG: hypothetical protein IPK19_07560 [Chloroflexi bacterium]|nr:hypothetical protein [Chloroflexota bacterium]